MKTQVFYAGRHYGEYPYIRWKETVPLQGLPDGAYIRFPERLGSAYWFRSDFTPVLPEDVPPELKALCLIMGLNL